MNTDPRFIQCRTQKVTFCFAPKNEKILIASSNHVFFPLNFFLFLSNSEKPVFKNILFFVEGRDNAGRRRRIGKDKSLPLFFVNLQVASDFPSTIPMKNWGWGSGGRRSDQSRIKNSCWLCHFILFSVTHLPKCQKKVKEMAMALPPLASFEGVPTGVHWLTAKHCHWYVSVSLRVVYGLQKKQQ